MEKPETSTCHYLQQTWQRQCAARPESVGLTTQLLQTSEAGVITQPSGVKAEASVKVLSDAEALYQSSIDVMPAGLRMWLDALPRIAPADRKTLANQRMVEQSRDGKQVGEASPGRGGRPQAPAQAADPIFKLMGSMNAGMMGLVPSVNQGPDLYDPMSPFGAEPHPDQTTGPEKCYRLLNSWLYKCALSPM